MFAESSTTDLTSGSRFCFGRYSIPDTMDHMIFNNPATDADLFRSCIAKIFSRYR